MRENKNGATSASGIPIIVIPLFDTRVILTSEYSIQISTYKDYHILFNDPDVLMDCKKCIDNGRRIAQDLTNIIHMDDFTVWKPNSNQLRPHVAKEAVKEPLDLKKLDVKLYSWGNNKKGQLGCSFQGVNDYTPFPVEVPDITKIVFCNAGSHHAAFVNDEGKVYVWGDNKFSQLGISGLQSIPRPTLV